MPAEAFTRARNTAEPVRFSRHLLANDHRYTFGIVTVDIDGDRVVSVAYSRQFVKAMKAKGYDVTYKEVPGGRHAMSLMHGFDDRFLDFFDAADDKQSKALGKE